MYTVYCITKIAYKNPRVTRGNSGSKWRFQHKNGLHDPTKQVVTRNAIRRKRIFFPVRQMINEMDAFAMNAH